MAGTLFLVATPIGNLEDITLRALRVLREVDLIAAEDTRRTARLLAHYGLTTPMLSFHEHNAHGRTPQLVARLAAGESVAVVTDAGTPGVSDPGVELVHACVEAAIKVDPIPGANAPLTAVVASGFPVLPLTICGFPPSRSKARQEWMAGMSRLESTITFFEAPHRLAQSLADAADYFGERQIMVARELTKLHQEFIRGTAAELARDITEGRGEITVVVEPPPPQRVERVDLSDEDLVTRIGLMTDSGSMSRGQLAAKAAKELGLTRREVYAALERAKQSVK
jgi:16S rRNA (cytidine1402-2'-O)-methyltransferase